MEKITAGNYNEQAAKEARKRWDSIAKPLHSLGRLEDIIVSIAGMTGDPVMHFGKKGLIIMCADNGVVAEGVTQTGQEITALVAENFLKDSATAAIFCRRAGADIMPIDIGIARDTILPNHKIAYGTADMLKGPAMTRAQAEAAIAVGMDLVKECAQKGYGILATGEMGIGNTTTSSAVVSVLLQQPVREMTGRGAGLTSDGLVHKIAVIEQAIALNQPDPADALDVVSKVGGLDIAGLADVFLGGAVYRIPIVIDGFISAAAALVAASLCPEAKAFMVASHVSKEPAAELVLDALGVSPILHAEMCLGEGTGAVLLFPILDMACSVYQGMVTFDDNHMEHYVPLA